MSLGGVLLLVAGLATAEGAEPVRLVASPSAVVEVLPAQHGRVDVLVHENTEDLRVQLRALKHAAVRDARAIDTGGDWVLSFYMRDGATTLELVGTPGTVVLVPVRTTNPTTTIEPLDAAAALAEVPRPLVCRADEVALSPLPTGETRWADAALHPAPMVPTWGTAEVHEASWAMVDEARSALSRPGAPRGKLLYRLGALHRELGHAREAAWYFGEAAGTEGIAAPDAAAALMQRARSLLLVGAYPAAANVARLAMRRGAPPEMVLHAVTLAAWLGRAPEAPGLGRALAGSATTIESRVLAAVVLGGGGCTAEALELLRPVARRVAPARRDEAQLFLADLLYRHGELDGAAALLGNVDSRKLDGERLAVWRQRGRLGTMARLAPTGWAAYLPDLRHDATLGGAASMDALHVLAQVYVATGEDREAIGAWTELLRRDESRVDGVAGARLATAWARRSAQLIDAEREGDALLLHRGAWNDGLAVHLDDLSPLAAVARGYTSLGFTDQALHAWKTIATTEEARGRDSAAAVHELAALYVTTGALGDARDSIRWLRRRPYGKAHAQELDTLELAARGEAPGQVSAATGCAGVAPERSALCAALAGEAEAQKAFDATLAKKRFASR